MRTRDQKFAAEIFNQVSEIAKLEKLTRNKYGSMAHKLPILIRTAGLVQALAFVDAREKDVHHTLLDHMAKVLDFDGREQLLTESRTAALNDYIRLTQKTMAALLWYKRFAQSVLGVEQGSETDTSEQEEEGEAHAAKSS